MSKNSTGAHHLSGCTGDPNWAETRAPDAEREVEVGARREGQSLNQGIRGSQQRPSEPREACYGRQLKGVVPEVLPDDLSPSSSQNGSKPLMST
jgi:hypothetical protein